jgi:hypothetical protein
MGATCGPTEPPAASAGPDYVQRDVQDRLEPVLRAELAKPYCGEVQHFGADARWANEAMVSAGREPVDWRIPSR